MKLTQQELRILSDLKNAAAKCMRSKPTLRLLSSLQAKGLIECDPFAGTARLTEAGLNQMKAPFNGDICRESANSSLKADQGPI